MAGTIPLSMTQQFDVYGKPLKGGQLYIIQAGTVSTPQDAFVDSGLTVKQPYPMTLDAAGRVPQFFLADGSVKIRLQDASGVVQLSADQVLVIGPSAGGGGGATVDQTQLIQTGMMMFSHTTAQIAGFTRLNGRTIGSSTSGATERNNQDCQGLFLFLWPDTNLVVSGGRGANALADWTANKQIALPDWRGYALSGLDDMGNTPVGRLTATFFGAVATVLGAFGGGESFQLLATHIPALTSANAAVSFSASVNSDNWVASNPGDSGATNTPPGGGGTGYTINIGAGAVVSKIRSQGSASGSVSVTSSGTNGAAHRTIGPRKLVTFYMKL